MLDLHIDIETYSDVDLAKAGVYAYAESKAFRVLIISYILKLGDSIEYKETLDLTRADERTLARIDGFRRALADPGHIKHAFNASFERVCLSYWLGVGGGFLDPAQWRCTMAEAAYWGVPGSLRQVGAYLGAPVVKDTSATYLMKRFCVPLDDPGALFTDDLYTGPDWQKFLSYCEQDAAAEVAIGMALPGPLPPFEQAVYALDQRINDRGIAVDAGLVDVASGMAAAAEEEAAGRMAALTGLENPQSPAQLLGWLKGHGLPRLKSVAADALEAALDDEHLPSQVAEVIECRLESAKAANKKYLAARASQSADGRMRGCFRYYGATTGRWSGYRMQLQNLARGSLERKALDQAREVVRSGDSQLVGLLFGSVPDTLKSLVRTALVPKPGRLFVIADFSAIEARVLAWLAGEKWVLDVFATTGDVYEAQAARMFGVSVTEVDKTLRQRGKVATLALGYQGAVGAMKKMGALRMGIEEPELPRIVSAWRRANPRIVRLWSEAEEAFRAVASGERKSAPIASGKVSARLEADGSAKPVVYLTLPSTRELVFRDVRVDSETGRALSYDSLGSRVAYERVDTYGGRITENLCQAIARDILAEAMLALDSEGLEIVAHVHDEVVIEAASTEAEAVLDEALKVMGITPAWAPGLPLNADGYVCDYYRKE
jgi:DNA polymerase